MNETNLLELLQVARETAVSAGHFAKEKFDQPRTVTSKGFRDLVTEMDIAVQNLIVSNILQHFPDHGFLPEETADLPDSGPIIWIIDPIDGTTNYSRQQPIFAISVAATRPVLNAQQQITAYEPLAGVVYDPMQNELFWATKGGGAVRQDSNGRIHPLHVSAVNNLNDAILCLSLSSSPQKRAQAQQWIQTLGEHVFTMRDIGSATLSLAWVAAGRLDIYINQNIKPWDVAAAVLLIEEAGGCFGSTNGTEFDWVGGAGDCLGTNGRIHTQTVQILTQNRL